MRFVRACCVLLFATACRASSDDAANQQTARADSTADTTTAIDTSTITTAPGTLPLIGIAVSDTVGGWCAEFMSTSVPDDFEPGQYANIVFASPTGAVNVIARVMGPRTGECYAAFPQPRWADYRAFTVELVYPNSVGPAPQPTVGLIVLGQAVWTRVDSLTIGDVDHDGAPEHVRRCAADEGEHFTVWSKQDTLRVRRWHEYYDWGGLVDRTCAVGEDGR